VLGLTFKENIADLRNSRVPDIVHELRQFGAEALVHDPLCDREEAQEEFGIELCDFDSLKGLDALILAVPHEFYLKENLAAVKSAVRAGGVFVDVKSLIPKSSLPENVTYWSL